MTERKRVYDPNDRWNKPPKEKLKRFIRNLFVREGSIIDCIIFNLALVPCYWFAGQVVPQYGFWGRFGAMIIIDLLLLAILHKPRRVVYEIYYGAKGIKVRKRIR